MSRPLSLAFVNSLPGWGGGEKWFLHTAADMARRGHRVCVVGQPDGELLRRAAVAGLRALPLPMHGIFDPRTLWAMGRMLRREGVDVAFTNQAREIRLVGLSQLGRPGFRQVARRGSPDPVKDVWHFRFVYTRLVHRMIVNCEALVPKVVGGAPWFDRSRVRVIPNGIDADALTAAANGRRAAEALDLPDDAPVIAMIGEVGARKDQATLLKALAVWRQRADAAGTPCSAVVLIAGEGPDRPRLEALGRELGVDDMVRWLGFRTDTPDLMAAADLLVLPTREEGFPNTLLEGMALGLPVVATPVDGIPELVVDGETGTLVPVGDPEALSLALARLAGDADLRRAMGEAGKRRAREVFSQQRVMDEVEALARELVSR